MTPVPTIAIRFTGLSNGTICSPYCFFLHGFCHSSCPRPSTQVVDGAAYPVRRHPRQFICRLVGVTAGYRLRAGWHRTTRAAQALATLFPASEVEFKLAPALRSD